MKHKIPNILTLTRILVVPVFLLMLMFHAPVERWLFLIIFTYASITDFLDGYLARMYNTTSKLGRIFDSLADKLLVIIVGIILAIRYKDMPFIVLVPLVVIIFRELLISGIRETLAEKKITLLSSLFAKLKTTIQLLALGFLIVGGNENLFYIYVKYIGIVLLYLAMIFSLFSGFQYVKKASDHF